MSSITSYKLTSPAKFARALVVLAIALGFTFTSFSGSVAGDSGPVQLDYITVQQGDSLWDLAGEHALGTDPRDWIAEVVLLNALSTIELTPGQQIALP
jgi:hypothetical protein